MAPEIFEEKNYSEKSDVYAFAILVYILVHNKKPFDNYSCNQIIYEVTNKNDRPKLNCNVFYQNLISKCWQKEPERRPLFNDIINRLEKEKPDIKNAYKNYLTEH